MDAEQILAFRLARSGLAARSVAGLAEAAACPASDFTRDAALLALSARCEGVSRERYERATDAGEVVVAHVVRGAIHALAPGDLALYGRALIARNEDELAAQLGRQVQRLAAERGFAVTGALEEVAAATRNALRDGGALDKTALHDALRERVDARLLPWCEGCRSQHVPPMLWRYATVAAGARLDSPPTAEGVRLIPPGDPYLQKPNRPLLAPAAELRRRLFRPVASPGAVLKGGRLAGLWRVRAKGEKAEIAVERLGNLTRGDLAEEVQRVAEVRGASDAVLALD